MRHLKRVRILALSLVLAACTGGSVAGSSTSTTSAPFDDVSTVPSSTTSLDSTTSTTPVSETTFTTTADFVRFIHPDEWTVVRSQCITDHGWPVTTTPDGGIEFPDIAEDQQPEMQAAVELCEQMFPVDPRYRQPLTVEQLTFLYNWFLTESIPCLKEQGYSDFDPPSLGVFIDTYDTEGWSPYRDLNTDQLPSMGSWYALQETCPQGPPVDDLFGS